MGISIPYLQEGMTVFNWRLGHSFRLCQQIRNSLFTIQETLRKEVPGISDPLTISGSLTVFNPNFPVVRIAAEADYALSLAKDNGKNKIAVFGEVLSWQEFENAGKNAALLKSAIATGGESRGFLERVKSSEIGFRSLQEKAVNFNSIEFPKVYRLKYYLRNVKRENQPIIEQIFETYKNALIADFISPNKLSSAAQFPVAARWAELLTKNNA
ncbi:hypothetical protein [Paraflavitalea speifideaquila]|uniref:hypothetical protein n=1 Tax=Paraflavitalea speifideaquila TaxID=3076558 RepID=UPI0028E6896E|nr:hypothetical protein [Paraflavitalea speifideiaquila]